LFWCDRVSCPSDHVSDPSDRVSNLSDRVLNLIDHVSNLIDRVLNLSDRVSKPHGCHFFLLAIAFSPIRVIHQICHDSGSEPHTKDNKKTVTIANFHLAM
jgi:hypothetical protein